MITYLIVKTIKGMAKGAWWIIKLSFYIGFFPFIIIYKAIVASGEPKPKRKYYKDFWGNWHWK